MIQTPRTLPHGKSVAIHVDGERQEPTYNSRSIREAHLAFYEMCLSSPDADIELRVDDHAALTRPAGQRDIKVTAYGEMLAFADNDANDVMKRLTVRIPRALADRLEKVAGKRGMNGYIAEAIREKLQRD